MKQITMLFTLLFMSGCGLLTTTFDGEVSVDFTVDGEGNEYSEIVTVDPNENEDVRDNRDRIKETTVHKITFSVENIRENNRAFSGSGEVYVRPVGGEWEQVPVATFEETPVEIGVVKELAVTPEDIARIEKLLDAPFEARIDGHVDQGPLAFDGRLTFDIEVKAGL